MKTYWDCSREEQIANRQKFDETYNDETTETHPFRCCDETTGYFTRKDGKPCTQEDVDFVYQARDLGQKTEFTLEDGKVKVYGFCDHGD